MIKAKYPVRNFIYTFFLLMMIASYPVLGQAEPAAAESGSFTIEQILSAPFPTSLTAAHTGNRLAWVFSARGVSNIWTAEGPDFNARCLTQFSSDDGRLLTIWGFSHDDRFVIFTKDGRFNPAHDPQGSGESILYRAACTGGEIEEIAKADSAAVSPCTEQICYVQGGELYIVSPGQKPVKKVSCRGNFSVPRWSPDGKSLLLESHRGTPPHRYSFVMIYHLETDKIQYIDPSIYVDSGSCWSPDGKKIAFLRRLAHEQTDSLTAREFPLPDPWEIRAADVRSGEVVSAWKSPQTDTMYNAELAWFDNDNLVFTSEADGWCHLYMVPAGGGAVRRLTEGKFEVERFIAVPKMKRVFFVGNAEDCDRRHIWSVSAAEKMKAVTMGDSIEWRPTPTADGLYIAYLGSSAEKPGRVFVKPLTGGNAAVLAEETMPVDFPKRLVIPRQVIFKAEDGQEIHGQLFMPPASFKGKRPAVMFFHGGPVRQMLLGFHYSYYYHNTYAMNQYLASRGYVVLAVNFRLGIGYGRAFRDVPDGGPRGCSEYRDLLAGAKYLRSLQNVDPGKIGLWGGSYGGLMTALGLARNSDLFAAGVDLHGVHDWNQWQAWSDQRENDDDRISWKSSPAADITDWRSPVLLIHGDDDHNVPFSETVWLAEELLKKGVDCELLILPDEVHSFLLHRSWVRVFQAAASFFDRKLR